MFGPLRLISKLTAALPGIFEILAIGAMIFTLEALSRMTRPSSTPVSEHEPSTRTFKATWRAATTREVFFLSTAPLFLIAIASLTSGIDFLSSWSVGQRAVPGLLLLGYGQNLAFRSVESRWPAKIEGMLVYVVACYFFASALLFATGLIIFEAPQVP